MPTPTDLRLLWEKATPAAQARQKSVSAADQTRLRDLESHSAAHHLADGMAKAQQSGASGLDALNTVFSGVTARNTQRQSILDAGAQNVRRFLQQGHLRAFAFERPRAHAAEPVEITSQLMTGHIGWEGGTLDAQSLRFVELRFMQSNAADTILATRDAAQIADQPAPRKGRPTVVPDIADAFDALMTMGKIDLSQSMNAHYPAIRAWLRVHRPDAAPTDAKPDSETIRRVISPLFKAARSKTNKQ